MRTRAFFSKNAFLCFWGNERSLSGGHMTVRTLGVGIVIVILVLAAPVFAQAPTGGITGKAVDGSGALIPGVEVSISSPAMIGGSRSAPTDETGTYRFTLLPPG